MPARMTASGECRPIDRLSRHRWGNGRGVPGYFPHVSR